MSSSQVVCFVCNLPILTHQVKRRGEGFSFLYPSPVVLNLCLSVSPFVTQNLVDSGRWDSCGKAETVLTSSSVTLKDPMLSRRFVPGSAGATLLPNSEPSARQGIYIYHLHHHLLFILPRRRLLTCVVVVDRFSLHDDNSSGSKLLFRPACPCIY